MEISIEQLKKLNVKQIQEIEDIYLELPESEFKFNYKQPKSDENFAERLVEDLK